MLMRWFRNRNQTEKTNKNEKNMKMNKQIMAVALVLGVAVSAQSQDVWVNQSLTGNQSAFPGGGGTATFSFEQTGSSELLQTFYVGLDPGSAFIFSQLAITSISIPLSGGGFDTLVNPTGVAATYPYPGATTAATIYNIVPNAQLAEGQPIIVSVAWTLSPGLGIENESANIEVGFTGQYNYGNASEVISAVPEPTQTVAGAMLLGCGGLIFAGRRLFKKQAA
jgi:hypothetical protein